MQLRNAGLSALQEPSERIAFWMTAIAALPAALLIGYVLHESIGASQVALFIVIAMVYVTLARGRLLGSSVRVTEHQYPRVFSIVKSGCAALEIPMPMIFVREDNNVPAVALGFGVPYSLVLSSHWIELFSDAELAFMIGRELGHIAWGHTRLHSLLSVNGNENALISLIFGAWLRRCALTCDRIGLLTCGSLEAAVRAMGIAAFHEFGRRVDYEAFAAQHADIASDSVLRWGEWLSAEPYATRRILSLRKLMATPLYEEAANWFARERSEEPPPAPAPGETTVVLRDCAGWWRRFAAYGIDAVIVSAIIVNFGGHVAGHASDRGIVSVAPGDVTISEPGFGRIDVRGKSHARAATASPSPRVTNEGSETLGPVTLSPNGTSVKVNNAKLNLSASDTVALITQIVNSLGIGFWLPVYLAVLVILAGQTFGMMIAGLRVVTIDFRKPSTARTIARYLIVAFLWWIILPMSLVWRRVLLHDRWTKTRVVKVERVVARITGHVR